MKILLFWIFLFFVAWTGRSEESHLRYSQLPDLPPNQGYSVQPGLAGPYTGVDDDVLIVAGGANFPEALPWDGGSKVYHDGIFLLRKKENGQYTWELSDEKIPFKSGYGGAIPTSLGLFCFGGNTDNEVLRNTWFIDYSQEDDDIQIIPGPDLPVALTNFAFAEIDGNIYLAGGISQLGGESGMHFISLNMSGENPLDWKWESLPAWQGKSRAFALGVGQSNGNTNCFYLFSGREVIPGQHPTILYDAYEYNPDLKTWTTLSRGEHQEFPVMAGTAFPLGASTIVFTSGADGTMMRKQQGLEDQIEQCIHIADNEGCDSLSVLLRNHLVYHPGFGSTIWAYNTISKEIYELDKLPGEGQVTTAVVQWGDDFVIPSGEIRPGIRTPEVLKIRVVKDIRNLSFLDMFVIAIYFLVLAWMGWFFSKRQKSTSDYFKGGGRVPWWAAGLSIFGTALSAITFMAIPAKTYATDWSYFMLNMTIFMVAPIIVWIFIPFYRKLNITTAYEYLEHRFNVAVRIIGSLSFILFQIGRMGVVMFLPSIALSVVTGIDIFICIGLMGIISLIYTMMGGIEAVIWTDVMQVVVLLGGALLSLGLIIFSIDGGFTTIVETAIDYNKFNVFDLTWSLKQPTVWVMLLGGIFANITTYGTDQTMVQRYLTTKSVGEAKRSVWTNAVLTIPATLIFFFVGTALFAFFRFYPQEANPTFANNDAIFPWYIASQLPVGLAGLLIAAIFAAAMSSLSSSMNSAATAWATDFHFRFGWNKKSKGLQVARIATLVVGTIGIFFALMMATLDIKSLWDEFQRILGLVIGGLGGVFLLGLLSKKAGSKDALIGLGGSLVVQVVVAFTEPVHLLAYSATGVLSCLIFGYLSSWLTNKTHPKL